MLFIIDKISALRSFINSLSWRKILQLTTLLFIVGSAYVLFETRHSIYEIFNGNKISKNPNKFALSKQSMDDLDLVIKKFDLIVAIEVSVVDFQKNNRIIVYTGTDNSELNYVYLKYLEQNSEILPLFNADVNNNERLVSLINGEYVCKPYKDMILYKFIPETSKYIEYTCSTGIPPFYGKFSGIVSLHLKREPSLEEMDQIRRLSREISNVLYERDF